MVTDTLKGAIFAIEEIIVGEVQEEVSIQNDGLGGYLQA